MPARQRALDAFPRSVPWILWVSVMHVCYIFLRDILIFILGGTNGSLPEYVRAIATDTALSEDVVPLLVLGGIFLVMPIISGAFIALVHLLMVRSPKWVQITAGAFTVLVAGALFAEGTFEPGSLDGFDFVYDGAQAFPLIVAGIYLSIFLGGRHRPRLVTQARHPPTRLPAAHDRESTTRAHGVRALHLRERRPLEARQWAQLPAHLGGCRTHGAARRVRGRHNLPGAHSAPSGSKQR